MGMNGTLSRDTRNRVEAAELDLARRCVQAAEACITPKLGPGQQRGAKRATEQVRTAVKTYADERGYAWKPKTW